MFKVYSTLPDLPETESGVYFAPWTGLNQILPSLSLIYLGARLLGSEFQISHLVVEFFQISPDVNKFQDVYIKEELSFGFIVNETLGSWTDIREAISKDARDIEIHYTSRLVDRDEEYPLNVKGPH